MDKSEKEDCKYWDKCYQKNEHHRQKYNHPEPVENKDASPPEPAESKDAEAPPSESTAQPSDGLSDEETAEEKNGTGKKRKSSECSDDNSTNNQPKRTNPQRLWQSPDEDYSELLKSNRFIHAKFLVKMPKDFYQFWDFVLKVKSTDKTKPLLEKVNLDVVGPYDFLAGNFEKVEQKSPGEYLRHWRFFYDPPEFQTIFVKKGTGIHYGYWRDDPKEDENLFIARNDAEKGCEFELVATNTFDALAYFLEKDFVANPFTQADLTKIRKLLNEFVSVNRIDRDPLYMAKNNRWKTVVAKTFHGAGIVVPVDKKSTIGYRPMIESDANIKKILSLLDKAEDPEEATKEVMDKLQPIITAAVIALDECDFGTNLELGIDLFCSGHEQLHPVIQSLLVPAYTLLERPQWLAILKAHLDDRKNSFELSILN